MRSGPITRVWIKTVYSPPQTFQDVGQYDQWLGRYEIDCASMRVSSIDSHLSLRGTEVGTSLGTGYADIVPDTPMETIAAKLCVRK